MPLSSRKPVFYETPYPGHSRGKIGLSPAVRFQDCSRGALSFVFIIQTWAPLPAGLETPQPASGGVGIVFTT